MSAGTYSSPRNSLLLRERSVKLTSLPSSLGNSPAKSENVSKHTTHVCWDIRLALKLVVARIEERQIDKVAKLLGQFSCRKCDQQTYSALCWDIQPALELIAEQVECGQIDEVAELLGQFTCKKWWKCQQNAQAHICWGIRLALKLVVARTEVRQIGKFAKLLGQFSCEQVKMSADIQRMCAGIYKSYRRGP